MNISLIGLGRWGETHLRVFRQLGVALWVADVSTTRLEWAVPACDGVRALAVVEAAAQSARLGRTAELS
jgi:hypothetical protein